MCDVSVGARYQAPGVLCMKVTIQFLEKKLISPQWWKKYIYSSEVLRYFSQVFTFDATLLVYISEGITALFTPLHSYAVGSNFIQNKSVIKYDAL